MIDLTTCLWFDDQAREAAEFYVSVFPGSGIGKTSYYTKEGFEIHHKPEGSVLTVEFRILGKNFLALNGGPVFRFNESVSFIIPCDTQEEIDRYWEKLSEGGDTAAQQCGWLKDRYGVSWQITSKAASDIISGGDRSRSEKVMKALLKMKKLDIEKLLEAANK